MVVDSSVSQSQELEQIYADMNYYFDGYYGITPDQTSDEHVQRFLVVTERIGNRAVIGSCDVFGFTPNEAEPLYVETKKAVISGFHAAYLLAKNEGLI